MRSRARRKVRTQPLSLNSTTKGTKRTKAMGEQAYCIEIWLFVFFVPFVVQKKPQ